APVSSSAPTGSSATRYSSDLISFKTPTIIPIDSPGHADGGPGRSLANPLVRSDLDLARGLRAGGSPVVEQRLQFFGGYAAVVFAGAPALPDLPVPRAQGPLGQELPVELLDQLEPSGGGPPGRARLPRLLLGLGRLGLFALGRLGLLGLRRLGLSALAFSRLLVGLRPLGLLCLGFLLRHNGRLPGLSNNWKRRAHVRAPQ